MTSRLFLLSVVKPATDKGKGNQYITSVYFIGTEVSRVDFEALDDSSLTFVYIDLRTLVSDFEYKIEQTSEQYSSTLAAFSECNLVWYQPGCFDLLPLQLIGQDTSLQYLQRQAMVIISYLEDRLVDLVRLVDKPSDQRRATNRLHQLDAIRTVCPHALLSSMLWHGEDLTTSGEDWVLKSLSESRDIDNNTKAYAQVFDNSHVEPTRNDFDLPGLAQAIVKNNKEYRSYCIFEEIYTIEISKPKMEKVVDTRYFPEKTKTYTTVDGFLPEEDVQKLRKYLGLNLMTIDYALVGDQAKIFEINPLFSWAWLPSQISSDISALICSQLSARARS